MKTYDCQTNDDCIRACIATLIDRDDVPHVFSKTKNPEESWHELRTYLASLGKTLVLFTYPDAFEDMATNNPDVEYILLCRNSEGDHAVVCKNDCVIHDPAWIKREILGKHSCGYWIIGVVI